MIHSFYNPPIHAIFSASATKFFVAIGYGDESKINLEFFRTYDIMLTGIHLPTLISNLRVTHLILFPDANSLYQVIKKDLKHSLNVIDYRQNIEKDINRLVQRLQILFNDDKITFSFPELEKNFLKITKSIKVKDISIEIAGLLVLIDYLGDKRIATPSQVWPSGIYV